MAKGDNNIIRSSYYPSNYGTRKNHGKLNSGNNLFNFSNIGLNWDRSLIRSSIAMGTTESNKDDGNNYMNSGLSDQFYDSLFAKTQDITRLNNNYMCFFDKDYPLRRQYLRDFAQNGEINFILETNADESIIYDDENYFAHLNLKQLRQRMKQNESSDKIIKELESAYKRVYQMYGWSDSNDAWSYMKKFLTDGFLAFEILYERDENNNAKNIIGFKELDPITLQPDIVYDETTGNDIKGWWQYKDDANKKHFLPDADVVYISWAKGNFPSRISYVEGLTRTFNMLRQLENSRIIWNIQNAQKRIKIVVPVGTYTTERQKQRIEELKAYYTEDTQINDIDGTITVNGNPNFSFNKTYIFPSMAGEQTDISDIAVNGYDLSDVEQMKYWWRRFMLETKLPPNRFLLDPQNSPNNSINGESSITREESSYSRFLNRIQNIFKELLLKPTWLQFSIKQPLFAQNNIIRSCLALNYNNDNVFELARIRQLVNDGATTVSSLLSYKDMSGRPFFSTAFLVKKYLGMTEEDLKENEKFKFQEAKQSIQNEIDAKTQTPQNNVPGMGDAGMGIAPDAGMGGLGNDMGQGMGMEDTGGQTNAPMTGIEPGPAEEPGATPVAAPPATQ